MERTPPVHKAWVIAGGIASVMKEGQAVLALLHQAAKPRACVTFRMRP
jgi:hypothetical protein